MCKLSEQVEQAVQDAKYWKKQSFFILEERDRAYDTINEQQAELDELIAERDSAYLNRDIAEDKVKEVEQERDLLAYENRNLAGFIKYNDTTLTDTDIGDIASSRWTDGIWDRFVTPPRVSVPASEYMISNNKELRRKLTKIENICNDMNEEE